MGSVLSLGAVIFADRFGAQRVFVTAAIMTTVGFGLVALGLTIFGALNHITSKSLIFFCTFLTWRWIRELYLVSPVT